MNPVIVTLVAVNAALGVAIVVAGASDSAHFTGMDGTLMTASTLCAGGLFLYRGWGLRGSAKRERAAYLVVGPIVLGIGTLLAIGLFRPAATTITIAGIRCVGGRDGVDQFTSSAGVVFDVPPRDCRRYEVGDTVICRGNRPPFGAIILHTCEPADQAAWDRRQSLRESGGP